MGNDSPANPSAKALIKKFSPVLEKLFAEGRYKLQCIGVIPEA